MDYIQIKDKIQEIVKVNFGFDEAVIKENYEVSFFLKPFEFSPIELVKLYVLIKQNFDLDFIEDDFKNYKFLNISSVASVVKRKLDDKNE